MAKKNAAPGLILIPQQTLNLPFFSERKGQQEAKASILKTLYTNTSLQLTTLPIYSWPISNVQSKNVLEVSPVYDQRNETEKEPLSETFVN